MRQRVSRKLVYLRMLILIAFGTAMAIPFVWMVGASFKPRAEVDEPHIVPRQLNLHNFPVVLDLRPDPITGRHLNMRFGRWYFNSLLVASAVTLLQVLTSAMTAYAFSRMKWPGRDRVFFLYLATLMIPAVVLMIPNFQIMIFFGFIDTYKGLIIPAAFSAFGTFLLRQFMLSIPRALDESAEIDGAGHWRIFWDVVMPLARPGLIALAIITFLGNYQSFFWPLVLINDPGIYTLPLGMLQLDSTYGRQTELIMAATVMNVIPLIAVFIVFQKFLVRGLQLGAVKG